jgi:short-subunit dehydrogenase
VQVHRQERFRYRAADLTDEVEKVKRLVRRKRCDIYVLITNAGLSGTVEEEIETLSRGCRRHTF